MRNGSEHLTTLVAEVAHHLELFVDDHEELEDLLLVGEELEQPLLHLRLLAVDLHRPLGHAIRWLSSEAVHGRACRNRGRAHAEGPRDRVHPHVTAHHRHVPLRARADQEPVAGEEDERPVGAALSHQQPSEDGERSLDVPVGDDRSVVPADHQVGALALADLVPDDLLDDDGVVVVVDHEAAAVGELDGYVGERLDQVVDADLVLDGDVDDDERGAVVDHVEATLGDLAEGHCHQTIGAAPRLGDAVLERDVEDRLDLAPGAADDAGRGCGLAPDHRPRVLPLDLLQEGANVGCGSHGRNPTGERRCSRPRARPPVAGGIGRGTRSGLIGGSSPISFPTARAGEPDRGRARVCARSRSPTTAGGRVLS